MKFFSWNAEKNRWLREQRNISFEEVLFYIEKGQVLDIVEHLDQTRYKNQKIMILNINDYAYLVPFMETDEEVFLKTIIPSRKATRKYLRGKDE